MSAIIATPTHERLCDGFLIIARTQQGVREVAGPKDSETIRSYRQYRTVGRPGFLIRDEIPWCSDFANWVVLRAGETYGLKGSGKANARSWLGWGVELQHPVPGCVVVLKRGPARLGWGHVAFFVRFEARTVRGKAVPGVILFGGNQGNEACERWYPLHRVLAYRGPDVALVRPEALS